MTRLDRLIKSHFVTFNNRQVDEAIESGLVTDRSGNKLNKGNKFRDLASLDLSKLRAHIDVLEKGNPELKISVVRESDGYWVIDKPPGIASHSLSIFDRNTVSQWAVAQEPMIASLFGQIQPEVTPHRLDTGTSGLLIVCKNRNSFEFWRTQFIKKRVRKIYRAWCWGSPPERFEVAFSLAHDASDPRKMTAPSKGSPYRAPVLEAQSIVHRICSWEGFSLVEVDCTSGVTHQVRAHLALSGFPLIGDSLYDVDASHRSFRTDFHQLRAAQLMHPDLDIKVSPLPEFDELFKRIKH